MTGDESSNLHQIALFAEAEGPSMMEFSAKNMYLPERKYLWILFKRISYKLYINCLVFCSFVLDAIWRKRFFFISILEKHTISLLAVSLTKYQAMLSQTWRKD